ncbi:helix-turn-helix transcriptional regulator [Streptomyces albidoflavus]|jgi:transcriptional regulator with XRE-family HTH domain|uniref:XRE family transcriptional regulator n=2 Tax=Streptomyces TaxID=1883 RepID=A0A126Y147_9ACTN|nr:MULTISPECIES: helix-turn-helix transcriptional regulator [Streptomyces]MYX49610.1 helix-turn-helix domain-containing protein [Streptomyces sp. SID8385]MYX85676.1 helix-turn-helix domain-containing protein [Streptomyces sp. SID4915]QLA56356.1 helix-turn-helix transcriptional regulator [Streptomyces violascens]SCE17049.1 Helix-turn-helix domain-containing protein [Streptomyces sp. IgraMP-1]BDH50316.1 transcriptional regulator [Streptomyces albus]
MQQRKKSSKKVTSWEVLGKQLAEFRRVAGLTQGQLADLARVGEDTVSSVEQGRRRLQADLAERLDEILETKRALSTAVSTIPRHERYPLFAQDFIEHERNAITLLSYQSHVIPGLLQTPEYARTVFENAYPPLGTQELEEAVQARIDRKEILSREKPPLMSFIIEECVLQRHLGAPEAMKRQIQHLRECAGLPFLSLQVMPTETDAHAGLAGALVLLETPDHDHLAYIEGQHKGFMVDDLGEVSMYQQKYGMLRAQALTPQRTKVLLDTLLGVT